jgi:hypothetical protein
MDAARLVRTGAAVALASVTLAGCATMNVSSYVERGVDLGRYRTFQWAPADQLATGDPRLDNNPFFQERVLSAVERELARKGLEKTTGTPDFLLRYHASVKQEIMLSGGDGRDGADVYDAGTLLIDFVDARTNRLLWRGWAEGTIDGVIDDQAWMEQRIDEAVARILERLPRRLT